jgi:hypothetical protein
MAPLIAGRYPPEQLLILFSEEVWATHNYSAVGKLLGINVSFPVVQTLHTISRAAANHSHSSSVTKPDQVTNNLSLADHEPVRKLACVIERVGNCVRVVV